MKTRSSLPLLLLLPLIWLVAGLLLPMTQDEAYYVAWTRAPDFGYFDHPPLVMLTALGTKLHATLPWLARLGVFLAAALTLFVVRKMYRDYLPRPHAKTATLLFCGSVVLLLLGVIVTPDTPLICCWALALHEAAAAINRSPKRWLTAGVFTGLGLLAKFTMVLIGPVFLWALIVDGRRGGRGLKSPWPYLGGLAALLVFLPHLWWNTQHEWITWRFQLRHGLDAPRGEMARAGDLPAAEKPLRYGPESQLAVPFLRLEEATAAEERQPRPYDALLASLNRYLGYYGSQLGLWGALLPVLFFAWWRRRRTYTADLSPAPMRMEAASNLIEAGDKAEMGAGVRALFVASVAVPLALFGLMALVTKVEANWSGMYVIGAALLLAGPVYGLMKGRFKALVIAAAINATLLVAAAAHARQPFLPTRPHRDRILLETHGYAQLADIVRPMPGPLFADTYQMVALLRFYLDRVDVRQWPGITRDSEFVRRAAWQDLSLADVRAKGGLTLVTTDLPPPHLPGFTATKILQLRDCKGMELQVLNGDAANLASLLPGNRCKKPVHEWYLVSYHAE